MLEIHNVEGEFSDFYLKDCFFLVSQITENFNSGSFNYGNFI